MKKVNLSTSGKGYYTRNGQVKGYFDLPLGDHNTAEDVQFIEVPAGTALPPVVPDFIADPAEILIRDKSAEILRSQAIDALITEGKLPPGTPKGKSK